MSTIRRRRPRVQFAQIPNAVLRDYRLSWRARGLLAELLSYPADYVISVDELVRRARRVSGATEGRDAMRAAVRELKAVGYIVSTRKQDAHGRWFTEVEVTDDPAYDMPNPPLDGVAVSPAPESSTPDAGVSAGRTDDGFPGVGTPGVGAPGVIKNTDTNTEINILPPTPSSTRASADDPARQEEEKKKEEGKKAEQQQEEAERLVASALRFWDSSHARPSAPTRRTLVDRVAQELAAGASPDAVLAELVRDLHPSQARSAVRVVMARTREPGWAQGGETPARLMANVRPAWCGVCDEATRHRVEVRADGRDQVVRCPRCHPAALAEPAEIPTTTPDHQEPQTAVDPTQSADDLRGAHHHQAGGDELTSGTGEAWDLPAPPAAERDRDAATDTAPHTSSDHSAPPLAVIADIRAKLAEIRRQTAR